MIGFCTIAAFSTIAIHPRSSTEIPIHYYSPSRFLWSTHLLDSFGDTPPTVKADDQRGVLVIDASDEELATLRWLVSTLDVPRRRVGMHLKVYSQIEKVGYEASAVISSLQTWRTSEDDTGIGIELTPRVNDDGTVTLFGSLRTGRTTTKINMRVDRGIKIPLTDLLRQGDVPPPRLAPQITLVIDRSP